MVQLVAIDGQLSVVVVVVDNSVVAVAEDNFAAVVEQQAESLGQEETELVDNLVVEDSFECVVVFGQQVGHLQSEAGLILSELQLVLDKFAVDWESDVAAVGVAEELAVEAALASAEESDQLELHPPHEAGPEQLELAAALVIAAAFAVQRSTSAAQSTAFGILADKVEVVDHLLYPEQDKIRYTLS